MNLLSVSIGSFTPLKFGPVTLPFHRQGLVLVEGVNYDSLDWSGSNRAGKSALFESIPWCWWGKMPRYGDRRLGDEPCHPIHGADVTVEFENNDDVFRVRRVKMSGKSAKLTIETKVVGDNGPRWVPVPTSALHAYEADMTPLLGFTYDTFRAALFLQASGFTVTLSSFGGQMKLLESVLRFDVLSSAGETAKQAATRLVQALLKAETEWGSLQREIVAAEAEIERLGALDEEATERTLEAEAGQLQADLNGIGVNSTQASRSVEENKAEVRRLYGMVRAAEARRDAQASEKDRVERLLSLGACPTCDQKIRKQAVAGRVSEIQDNIETEESNIEIASTAHDAALAELQKAEGLETKVKWLERDLASKRKELEAVRQRRSTLADVISTARLRHAGAVARSDHQEHEIERVKWDTGIAQFWVKGFGSDGLKAEILGASAPVLNEAARRYGEILSDGKIVVEFDPIRMSRVEDLIKIKIDGKLIKYETCSSSEKRRVDIIVALSLRSLARWRLAQPVNVGLADELFDTLDDQGLQRVLAVVQQDMEELSSLFVVTHNTALKALLPGAKTWRVIRRNGEATVHVG